jgi:hypothetical protein
MRDDKQSHSQLPKPLTHQYAEKSLHCRQFDANPANNSRQSSNLMFTRVGQNATCERTLIRSLSRTAMRRKKIISRTSFDRDRRRGLITCACLSAILAAAVIGGGTVLKISGASSNTGREMAYLDAAGALRSSPILFVPIEGNVCRRRVIDNQTWRIRDDGFVECDEAVTWNSGAENQKYFVTVRVDAIRAGFKATPK